MTARTIVMKWEIKWAEQYDYLSSVFVPFIAASMIRCCSIYRKVPSSYIYIHVKFDASNFGASWLVISACGKWHKSTTKSVLQIAG